MEYVLAVIAVLSAIAITITYRVRLQRKKELEEKKKLPNSAHRYFDLGIPPNIVFLTKYGEYIESVSFKEESGTDVIMYYSEYGNGNLQYRYLNQYRQRDCDELFSVGIKIEGLIQNQRLVTATRRFQELISSLRKLTDYQIGELENWNIEPDAIKWIHMREKCSSMLLHIALLDELERTKSIRPVPHLSINEVDLVVSNIETKIERTLARLETTIPPLINDSFTVGFGGKLSRFNSGDRITEEGYEQLPYIFVKYLDAVEFSEVLDYPLDCVIANQEGLFQKDFSGKYKLIKKD